MSLRKAVFWVHLICGVAAGGVILMMSVTGVLLTYQKQMTEWSDRQYWVEPAVEGVRAPLSAVIASAERFEPEAEVSSVLLYSDADAPIAASLGGGRTLYLDPSTAEVRGENTKRMRAFFSGTVRMHRWFGATGKRRTTARAITGWSNLVFFFLVLSGLYLWMPARWTTHHVRSVAVLNTKARGKARDFNWHHVFGFWMAIPLALVVGSATVISFPWASDLAYRVVGDTPPVRAAARSVPPSAPATSPGGAVLGMAPAPGAATVTQGHAPVPFDVGLLDGLVEPAMSRLPEWRTISVPVPEEAVPDIEVRISTGWGGEPQKRYTARYEASTGRELTWQTFEDQSRGRRFRTFLRFAHTGEFFGMWGQTFAGVASLAAVLLVWSGLALAWRRLVLQPLRRRLT